MKSIHSPHLAVAVCINNEGNKQGHERAKPRLWKGPVTLKVRPAASGKVYRNPPLFA